MAKWGEEEEGKETFYLCSLDFGSSSLDLAEHSSCADLALVQRGSLPGSELVRPMDTRIQKNFWISAGGLEA